MGALVVNMIPFAQSGETNQDSEPNLAVNPANPDQIAGSAFTPDPLGGPNAPIFVSSDGGNTWALNSIVPSNAGSATGDITLRFATTSGILYAGILRRPGSLRLNILRTTNFLGASTMTVLVDRTGNGVDQPYVQAATAGTDRVYVGDNDFNAASGRTATIDQSLDGAIAAPIFNSIRIESRVTSGQDGPPIRPAVHPDGTVYAVFYGWRAFTGSQATADVVIVRDDNWGSGATPFSALTDPSDGLAGRLVVTGRTVPWANFSTFGQERFVGSNITIAVDPRNSSVVYVAWADRVGATDYTLHVRRSGDRGATWSAADIRTITNATNPALAINSRGVVGFLYQQLTGSGASQRWQTHLERTSDDWATAATDLILADVPANAPAVTFIPYIGDYVHLMAVGKDFYGIFSANNTPNNANFPNGVTFQRNADFATQTLRNVAGTATVAVSIDPFFFRVRQIALDQDFYVRDWTDSASSADPGLEPSTHPHFYVNSDVWNRRSNAPGGFNANDQPQSEDPQMSSLGDNFAFARVHRKASGPAQTVNLHFLYSEFGTGSNYIDAGTGADPTLSFAAVDTVKTMTAGRAWTLPVTTSTHTCLAVEISTPDDPVVAPSLLGRAPGWPSTDLSVLLDNNKAQRNMGVYPVSGRGFGSFYAVLHNAATARRDMRVRMDIPDKVRRALRTIRPQVLGGKGTVESGVVLLPDMSPGENRWVEVRVGMPEGQTGDPLPVSFLEEVGGVAVNGFAIAPQPAPLSRVFLESLRLQVAVLARIGVVLGSPESEAESKATARILSRRLTAAQAVAFLRSHAGPISELATEVIRAAADGDILDVRRSLQEFRTYTSSSNSALLAPVHVTLMHKLDAALTMITKAKGDPADVLQSVRWQAELFQAERLARLEPSARIRKASEKFARGYPLREVGNADYPKFLKARLNDLRSVAGELGSPGIVDRVAALESSLRTVETTQAAHRALLLELDRLIH